MNVSAEMIILNTFWVVIQCIGLRAISIIQVIQPRNKRNILRARILDVTS
jgi:hypothetical protein